MPLAQTRVLRALVIAAVATSLTLSGCTSGLGADLLDQAGDDPSGELITTEVSVPTGWPDSVPLPPGRAMSAGGMGTSMTYQTLVGEQETAVAHADAIEAAGFEVVAEQVTGTGGVWSFNDGTWALTYQVVASDQDDGSRYAFLQVESAF